jgi:hypothetical protein
MHTHTHVCIFIIFEIKKAIFIGYHVMYHGI